MIPVPSLADIVADGSKLADLPFRALWGLLHDLNLIEREITSAMLAARDSEASKPATTEDRALTIEQAAERLQIAPATMKRWLRKEPYNRAVAVRSRTCVRVSAQRLEAILLESGAGRPRRKAVSV